MNLILTDKSDRIKLINWVRKDHNLLRCGLFYADSGLANPVEVYNPEDKKETYLLVLPEEIIETKTFITGLNVIVEISYCSLDNKNVKRQQKQKSSKRIR